MPSLLPIGDLLLTSAPGAVAQHRMELRDHLLTHFRAMSLITTTLITVARDAQPCGPVWSKVPTWVSSQVLSRR